MKYQNDYGGVFDGTLLKDGCLACSIAGEIEDLLGLSMSDDHFLAMIRDCFTEHKCTDQAGRKIPVLSDEQDKAKMGLYVNNHERFGTIVLSTLGSQRTCRYVGRMVMPWHGKDDFLSFGFRTNPDFLILQIITPNGGHFRGANKDPWRGGTRMLDLKSIRYYRVE